MTIRMMIAAPASGSGKTAVTCGMLALLKRMNHKICAFKCGPDYIDPMFHRSILGVQSCNLDLFLSSEARVKAQYAKYSAGHDAVVCEGVMGFYDGVAGTTTRASAWHVADVLDLPVILVMRPKGASLTLAAQIKGMCALRHPHHIAGVIFNECSAMMYQSLAETIQRESGIPVLGYLPPMEEAKFDSRHLGLYTAGEIDDLADRIDRIALQMERSIDVERLMDLIRERWTDKTLKHNVGLSRSDLSRRKVTIAVAEDKAFCFVYRETLDAFQDAGATLVRFSPLHDQRLPEGICGLYLPGGYPELYAEVLSKNETMRRSVADAVKAGMPTVAECGGFLYLGEQLQGNDGRMYSMAGVLSGVATKQERLVRFGYATLRASEDSLLFRAGEEIPAHEFHYWDSTENGDALQAVKPVTGRSWRCGIVTDALYAGFPHLYFAGKPELAVRFVDAAGRYGGGRR